MLVLLASDAVPRRVGADGVSWPRPLLRDASDPIASLRWQSHAWVARTIARSHTEALRRLDARIAAAPLDASAHAMRSIALRALQRFVESQAALDRAVALDVHVMDDPDVLLTAAYLDARSQRWLDAVGFARRAIPRLSTGRLDARRGLLLEVAVWSMARGSDGLAEAMDLVRELLLDPEPPPVAFAMLALAQYRSGDVASARATASRALRGRADTWILWDGSLTAGELDAATGTALALRGQREAAAVLLQRALSTCMPVWRPSLTSALALPAARIGP